MPNRFAHLSTLTFALPDPAMVLAAAGDEMIFFAPINTPSDDGRVIVDSVGWRSQVPIMFSDSEQAHTDARHVGNAVDISLQQFDGVMWAVGRPVWDSDELAVEAHRLIVESRFNGVSVHLGAGRFAEVCPTSSGGYTEIKFPEDYVPVEVDGEVVMLEAPCETPLFGAFEAEIAAVTIVAVPAFADARIEVEGAPEEPVEEAAPVVSVAASAAGMPVNLDRPPAAWFADQNLDGPTPLTVTDEGQVFGHLAVWDTCHTGFQGRCIRPKPGQTDYALYLTARVIDEDGNRIPVGPLVVDDGHASPAWSIERIVSYYADTRLAAAYVTVGEDTHGPWVAGAVAERATSRQIEVLRRHALSGDWRKVNGKFSLMAVVSVNAPGYPVPEVLVAAGVDVGLITYGPEPEPPEQLSDLELLAAALERFSERLSGIEARLPGTIVNMVKVGEDVAPIIFNNRIDSDGEPWVDEDLEAAVDDLLVDTELEADDEFYRKRRRRRGQLAPS